MLKRFFEFVILGPLVVALVVLVVLTCGVVNIVSTSAADKLLEWWRF